MAVAIALIVQVGCSSKNQSRLPPGDWDKAYAIPREAPIPGDPARGLEVMLTEDLVGCGVPYSLYWLGKQAPFVYRALPSMFSRMFDGNPAVDAQGRPLREGAGADMPAAVALVDYQEYDKDGDLQTGQMVVPNCLLCHSSEIDGKFMIGLGDTSLDFTVAFDEVVPPEVQAYFPCIEREGVTCLADSLAEDLLPNTLGIGRLRNLISRFLTVFGDNAGIEQTVVGANPAVNIAVALATHHDAKTLAWSDVPHSEPARIVAPQQVPPWWHTQKKAAHFSNGMSRGDHRGTMALTSMTCIDSNEDADRVVDLITHVWAFARSVEAPPYPRAINQEVAARGKTVFEATCAGCHGTYSSNPRDETYPNLLVPVEVIGTDYEYAEFKTSLDDWFNSTAYGDYSTVKLDDPTRGYIAPPLDGIWATAPYLHNGSVPTLAAMLDSSKRPTYWRRVDYDSRSIDWVNMGWKHEVLPHGQSAEPDPNVRKHIYDTTIIAHGKQGHTYGDELDERERGQLLEYLKTL